MTFTTIQLINEVTHVIETYPNNMFFPKIHGKRTKSKRVWHVRTFGACATTTYTASGYYQLLSAQEGFL